MVQGPINRPKDAISPLTGIVETAWCPYTFTMNWIFTRPGLAVRFEKGEPICHIYPIRRRELDRMAPELQRLSDNPALKHQLDVWSKSRTKFNSELKEPQSAAAANKWQKHYYRGQDAEGNQTNHDHYTRLRLAPFRHLKKSDGLKDEAIE
jgi:hypothetical protein